MSERELTKTENDFLWAVYDMQAKGFSGLLTSQYHRRKVGLRLKRRGLLREIMLQPCDGDGFSKEGHQERPGFTLTWKGHDAIPEDGRWKGDLEIEEPKEEKLVHILSDTPDGFGCKRQSLCGVYNPEILAAPGLINVEKKGIRVPVVSDDDDPEAIREGYRICKRCLESLKVRARWKRESPSSAAE